MGKETLSILSANLLVFCIGLSPPASGSESIPFDLVDAYVECVRSQFDAGRRRADVARNEVTEAISDCAREQGRLEAASPKTLQEVDRRLIDGPTSDGRPDSHPDVRRGT